MTKIGKLATNAALMGGLTTCAPVLKTTAFSVVDRYYLRKLNEDWRGQSSVKT